MGKWYQYLQELNHISVCVRIFLAVLCGGIIGMERGVKGRAAGFRTHILVCVGAALTMMTGQYIIIYVSAASDPARLGAQVISGIGFLGVGTIITTKTHRVRGLTTAAGLWTSACLGTAIGIGFYEAAVIGTIVVIVAMITFQRVDRYFYGRRYVRDYMLEIDGVGHVREVMSKVKDAGYQILQTTMEQEHTEYGGAVIVILTVKSSKKRPPEDFLLMIGTETGVLYAEEL